MIVDDQRDTRALLESPATFGGERVERVDTHTACVFLAGDLAYKLKRAVRFDYLDFSTPDLRRRYCEAEIRLNRRTAPGLYRRVVPVTRDTEGRLSLGGDGVAVDWVIEMRRFPQDCLLDRRAVGGRLDLALVEQLAAHIAAFHLAAERRFDHGGRAGMQWVADGNSAGLAEYGTFLDTASRASLARATNDCLERNGALLDRRRAAGFVRHCHGDLHLGNIVLLDGEPTLFDGIEFNDEIACVDVLYDLAFLLMDLLHRRLARHANVLLNRYLSATDDLEGLTLLPLLLSCRAAVRAKTSATAARMQSDAASRAPLTMAAREYFEMAGQLLAPVAPRLIAVGGFSGTGKSTLALALAPDVGPAPGALVFRSDEIRKRLLNAPPHERLGAEGYGPAVTARVYTSLAEQAARALAAGHAAIVDAVFADEAERGRIEATARDAGVPFTGLWLEASEDALVSRVSARRDDASDADASIVRMQLEKGAGVITWSRVDASATPDAVQQRVRATINTAA